MKKEVYERAEIVISMFRNEDVVTASIVPEETFVPEITTEEDDLEVLPFG